MINKALILLLVTMPLLSFAESRGVRNNNPGNIVKTEIDWKGEVQEGTDERFEQFVDAEHGIRAMIINLLSYQNVYGLHTTRSIMERWAPLHENSAKYHDYVVEVAGEGGSLLDEDYLFNLVKAIIYYENGYHPYEDNLIKRVIKEYLIHD